MTPNRQIAEKCLRDEAQAILDLIPQLDENFDKAVDLILACTGKVILTGVGKSGHIAAKIAATLSSTGTPSFYINPLDVFHGDLGVITQNDIVVGISNSGQTDELLRFVPFLLDRHIPLIGISGNASSLLARYATCHITVRVEVEACPLNLAPTSSTTATLAIGDALACALMEARKFGPDDFARYHPGGALGHRLLITAQDVMRTEDLPILAPHMKLGEAIIRISNGMLGLGIVIDGQQILGIITDGDIRRAVNKLQERFFNLPVEQAMTPKPICVAPTAKVNEILDILNERKIHAVLVTDGNGQLMGVVDNFRCMI